MASSKSRNMALSFTELPAAATALAQEQGGEAGAGAVSHKGAIAMGGEKAMASPAAAPTHADPAVFLAPAATDGKVDSDSFRRGTLTVSITHGGDGPSNGDSGQASGTTGYLSRSGSIFSDFLASFPLLKCFDPVAILSTPKNPRRNGGGLLSSAEAGGADKAEKMFAGKGKA